MSPTHHLSQLLATALLAAALCAPARAGDEVQEATVLLSRYPEGSVPVEPGPIEAIRTLGDEAGPEEMSLLRSIAAHERSEVADAAVHAMARIRSRQHSAQRAGFSSTLPNADDLEREAKRLRLGGLGSESSTAAAYANLVLGESPTPTPPPAEGQTEVLLRTGHPRRALASATLSDDDEVGLLGARAREDLKDPRGAVRDYARLAARGSSPASIELEGFGVDPERLLLGMLVQPHHYEGDEAEVMELLVRRGGDLTVMVLAERTAAGSTSERAMATDALGRMLDGSVRDVPLHPRNQREARRALVRATREGPDAIRAIARDALE